MFLALVTAGAGRASITALQAAGGTIIVEPVSGLITSEAGRSAAFSIRLGSRPQNAVKINLESSDGTEGTISADSVTLNPGNWDRPKTITITGGNDQQVDGDVAYRIITHPASSNDAGYDNLDPPDITVINLDDDVDETPVALDDTGVTNEDESVTTSVLANDSGLGNQPLTVILLENPPRGTAEVLPDHRIEYTPQANFSGSDAYRYRVCDKDSDCSSARVAITVNPINDGPFAQEDTVTTSMDKSVNISVLANDRDPDGDAISLESFETTSEHGGSVARETNGTPGDRSDDRLIFTPPGGFEGADHFRYTISDGSLTSSASVTALITLADQQPPLVEWIHPVQNEEIYYTQGGRELVTLQVRVEDNLGVRQVRFLRWDGVNEKYVELGFILSSPFQLNLDTSTLNPQWNQVFAIAYDHAGNASPRQFIWIFRLVDGAYKLFLPALRN